MKKSIFITLLALIMCVPLFASCLGDKSECSENSNVNLPKCSEEHLAELKRLYVSNCFLSIEPVESFENRIALYYLGKYVNENTEYEGILVTEKFKIPELEGSYGFGNIRGIYLYADGQFHGISDITVIDVEQRKSLFKTYYAVLAELLENQKLPD